MQQTIQEAIGQLIVGKVPGPELDDDTKDCLKTGIISGITVFKDENVKSPEQLLELCDAVRRVSWHPAFIAVDQEGGPVQRLDEVVSCLPSMMALGRLNDAERLKLVIALSGKQLRLLGFNCVLAPVLDCNTNPANPIIGTRAFSEKPERVARFSDIAMRTYLDSGVLPVAKHFPGHGDTASDSHLELPRLAHSRQRLEEIELFPFRENLLTTPAMLVAHLWVECLDKEELPATLSANVSTKLLKDELGFQNLVISDDMLMKAITNKWGLAEACVRAISAGVDLLLVCSYGNDARTVHKAILDAYAAGRITEERIFAACRARKAALNKLPPHDEMDKTRRLAALKRSVAAAEQMLLETSSSAIELSRGIPRNVFAGDEPIHLYIPDIKRYEFPFVDSLVAENPNLGRRLFEHKYSPSLTLDEIEQQISHCTGNCILVTFRTAINRTQIEFAKRLQEVSKERLLIAADVPYDLDLICDWDNAVALFDPSNLAVRAFARLMTKQLGACNVCGH